MSDAERHVSYAPTDGLSYDPSEARYWDESALEKEIDRAFDICHGCRMCFKYCDAFPTLFAIADERHGGNPRELGPAETDLVMDACFQCKLCEVQCPYTPRDAHAFQLDFPKLVHRFKAVRGRKRGFTLRDRVLGNPDGAGKMARLSLGMANVMNRVSAHRWFLEKVLGIDRRKELPEFAGTTFERWAETNGRIRPSGEAVLFPTCYVQNNEPQIGRDALEVLDRNGVRTACAKGLECCGMPAWEHGDLDGLRARARKNLDTLMPFVDAGAKVLALNPTCTMMMRREYPELVDPADRERAKKLAANVMDPSEYLWSIREEERFARDVKSRPNGPLAYHAPCHLRAQAVGFRSRDLFKKLLGATVVPVIECCGHDGTYAMTVEGFEPAQKAGQNAFRDMHAAQASTWSTDCPLAAIQFHQFAGVKPAHPMSILARAYRGDPFPPAQGASS